MLSRNISVVDIEARHWRNLLGVFAPGAAATPPILYLLMDEGRCVKAIHNKRGPILGLAFDEERDAVDRVAREFEVRHVALVNVAWLPALMHAWQDGFDPDEDWDTHIRSIAQGALTAYRDGIRWHPSPPSLPRLPGIPAASRLRRAWPDGRCVGLFVFEGKTPYTSLILRQDGGSITVMTTLDAFGLADGPLDWRTQGETVAQLCARQFGPLHGALWIERATLDELRAGPRPITFLRESIRRGRALVWPRPAPWALAMWYARVFKKL